MQDKPRESDAECPHTLRTGVASLPGSQKHCLLLQKKTERGQDAENLTYSEGQAGRITTGGEAKVMATLPGPCLQAQCHPGPLTPHKGWNPPPRAWTQQSSQAHGQPARRDGNRLSPTSLGQQAA